MRNILPVNRNLLDIVFRFKSESNVSTNMCYGTLHVLGREILYFFWKLTMRLGTLRYEVAETIPLSNFVTHFTMLPNRTLLINV